MSPLETNKGTFDLMQITETVAKEFEVAAASNLENFFQDLLNTDDIVTCLVKEEALRFDRRFYWRHLSHFEEYVLMLARIELSKIV